MKKKFTLAVLAGAMTLSFAMTSFAGTWKQDNIGWWWQEDNGSYPTSTWQWIDGNNDGIAECYCFNNVGYMLENTTTPDNYQVNAEGAWIVNGVVQTKMITVNDSSDIKRVSETSIKKEPTQDSKDSIPDADYKLALEAGQKAGLVADSNNTTNQSQSQAKNDAQSLWERREANSGIGKGRANNDYGYIR